LALIIDQEMEDFCPIFHNQGTSRPPTPDLL